MLKRILAVSTLGLAMAVSACDQGAEEQAEVAPVEEQQTPTPNQSMLSEPPPPGQEQTPTAQDEKAPTLEKEGVEVQK